MMKFDKEVIPTLDRLVNYLNTKNTTSIASHLVNFKRDPKKHQVKTSYTYRLLNEEIGQAGEPKIDILASFKRT